MKHITQTYTIKAPVEKVWQALVDAKVINEWGGGPATMDDAVGTEFTLWGGDIHGTNQEVEPKKKLVQKWYGGEWEEPSLVTFTLEEKDDHIKIHFNQENIPDDDAKSIAEGWDDYYLGAMKKYLEAA